MLLLVEWENDSNRPQVKIHRIEVRYFVLLNSMEQLAHWPLAAVKVFARLLPARVWKRCEKSCVLAQVFFQSLNDFLF